MAHKLCVWAVTKIQQAWPVNSMGLVGNRQNRVIAIFKMHAGGVSLT